MRRTFLGSKVHRVTVTETDVAYEGSITLDPLLMDAARVLPYERVEVYDVDNGERFATYLIAGEPGSGVCCVNGAAARKTAPGHRLILASYVELEPAEIAGHAPSVVLVDGSNRVARRGREIRAGTRVG